MNHDAPGMTLTRGRRRADIVAGTGGDSVTGEPEPTGWELMRVMEGIRGDVSTAMQNMVTQTMLAIYQQAQRDTDERQNGRIRAVEEAQEKRREEREKEQTEARKMRAQQNFSIALAAITAVLGLGSALILELVRP